MRITKYVLALVFSIGLAIPSFAVELSLGGFPSFMRFRWRTLTNATAHHVTNPPSDNPASLSPNVPWIGWAGSGAIISR